MSLMDTFAQISPEAAEQARETIEAFESKFGPVSETSRDLLSLSVLITGIVGASAQRQVPVPTAVILSLIGIMAPTIRAAIMYAERMDAISADDVPDRLPRDISGLN